MSPAVTRRGLVRAAGAAIGATAAGIGVPALAEAVIPAPDSDARLFDLIRRHTVAVADMHRITMASDAAFKAFLAAAPPRPDALRQRDADFPRTGLGVGLSDLSEAEDVRFYGVRGVSWMRDRPVAAWFPGRFSPLGADDEARRLEIIGAWDAHQAERHAVEVVTGYAAACEAVDTAAEVVCDLNAEIARSQPRTLSGLRALGAWFGRQVEADHIHDDFFELFAATVAGFGEVAT